MLLSGGNEVHCSIIKLTKGVLVYWKLNDNKCNFCPRLGSSILSLKSILNDNATLIILEDNSILSL